MIGTKGPIFVLGSTAAPGCRSPRLRVEPSCLMLGNNVDLNALRSAQA
jgi:hypothetical protein